MKKRGPLQKTPCSPPKSPRTRLPLRARKQGSLSPSKTQKKSPPLPLPLKRRKPLITPQKKPPPLLRQLAVLAALAAHMAVKKGRMTREQEREVVGHLLEAPAALNAALAHDDVIAAMAPLIAPARDVLYLANPQRAN